MVVFRDAVIVGGAILFHTLSHSLTMRPLRISKVNTAAQIVLAGTTPEDGAALDGPVRTVRVWFDQAPQVSKSALEIAGPGNRAKVEGLHTMGENDLMGRVSGPMPDGEWTMRWTAVGPDGEEQTGSITFTVERRR